MARAQSAKPSNDDILDIATREFANKGFEGARVDEIAAAAGVNKATLYYRIGDKEALFAAAMVRILSTKLARLDEVLPTKERAADKLKAFARVIVEAPYPEQFAAIMLREVGGGGRNLPDVMLPLMGRMVRTIEEIFEQGEREGTFRAVNPFLAHNMLMSGCAFYASNKPIRQRVAANAPDAGSLNIDFNLDDAAEAMVDMMLHGVMKAE